MKSPPFNQNLLFPAEELLSDRFNRYDLLFSTLNASNLECSKSMGRNPFPRSSILKALVYKNIRSIYTLSDLVRELFEHPTIALKCGFNPFKPSPSVERFSSFLKDTPNDCLQLIRADLVNQLIRLGEISGRYLSTDSCPLKASVKENNLKTTVKDRFLKDKVPLGDSQCRLGIIVVFPTPSQKKIGYFWGYRNHVITDTLTELPIAEVTKPANVHDSNLLVPQLKYVKENFNLSTEAVIGDSAFDSASIIEFIVKELGAKPIIAKNPRGGQTTKLKLSSTGAPICIAGFEMLSRGIFSDKKQNRVRHKFVCPIRGSKKFAKKVPICPWWHPRFLAGSGCTTYLRVDVNESIRQSVNYGSEEFKKMYNLRTGSERVFSRLLSICMQYSTVKGLNSTANICTIAHITVLAVALAAIKAGQRDKIRFIKTLIPNL